MHMTGFTADGTVKITDGFLLGVAIMFEIPFLMIVLSWVLKYGVNRWANIIAATLLSCRKFLHCFLEFPLLHTFFTAPSKLQLSSSLSGMHGSGTTLKCRPADETDVKIVILIHIVQKRRNKMKTLQKFGGIAALYMALAHMMGLIIFIVILDYISITDLAQKVAMNVDNQAVVYSTNLLMYVFFGFFLIVLSLALYDRLKAGAPALMQVATVIGIIWAGSLIASGMVANAGTHHCSDTLC